jgi:uncharacterized membrane protein
MMKRLIWPLVIGISSILFVLATALNIQSPLRGVVTFWFLLVCPGMAFIRLLHLREMVVEWVLAVALSIAIGTVFAEAGVVNRIWSPVVIDIALAGVSLLGAGIQVFLVFRSQRSRQAAQ